MSYVPWYLDVIFEFLKIVNRLFIFHFYLILHRIKPNGSVLLIRNTKKKILGSPPLKIKILIQTFKKNVWSVARPSTPPPFAELRNVINESSLRKPRKKYNSTQRWQTPSHSFRCKQSTNSSLDLFLCLWNMLTDIWLLRNDYLGQLSHLGAFH